LEEFRKHRQPLHILIEIAHSDGFSYFRAASQNLIAIASLERFLIFSFHSQFQFSTMSKSVQLVVEKYEPRDKSNLIKILQEVQREEGYITSDAVEKISTHLWISRSQIYGVASFYAQFKFNPPGRHSIKICLGTACHVQGGDFLLNALKSEIGISPNETTEDGRFDLERVACLGCCALAPVVMIDDTIYSNMSVIKLKETLSEYE
jgi:NADH-quinone oxidoreductase subunit E